MTSIAVAHRIQVRYGRRQALRGVDVSFEPGVTALLGPNGAGKTTLLSCLAGLRRPSSGALEVLGVDMTQRSAPRQVAVKIGYLPQHTQVAQQFTTQEFVRYAAWLKRVPRHDVAAAVESALTRVNLTDRAGDKLGRLSGGMLRRVAIAATIVHRPQLLILDEPSVGLDPGQRADLQELLANLSGSTSILLSTHLLEDVTASCDRVVVLDDGVVRFTGLLSDFQGSRTVEGAYRGVVAGRDR